MKETTFLNENGKVSAFLINSDEQIVLSYLKKENNPRSFETIAYHTKLKTSTIKNICGRFFYECVFIDSFDDGYAIKNWLREHLKYSL